MLPSERATEAVKQRHQQYGHPRDVYALASTMWSMILECPVSIEQIAQCMMALKFSREINKHHPDNLTDICGYTNVLEMVLSREGEEMGAS